MRLPLPFQFHLFPVLALALACTPVKESKDLIHFQGKIMGTIYNIKIAKDKEKIIEKSSLGEKIKQSLNSIDSKMSTYKKDSEISRFNRNTKKTWFNISEDTAIVISKAIEISKMTKGMYDITISPLVNLWGFGPVKKPESTKYNLPTENMIQNSRKLIGYKKIALKKKGKLKISWYIRKKNPYIQLDLSSLAKGYAVDKVSDILHSKKIVNFMVEIGGEVKASGVNQNNKVWQIGLENPFFFSQGRVYKIVKLKNRAMATSGDYRNFIIYKNKKYSHTINPFSGFPVEHNLSSVSVIHTSCMEADAFATAIMVMGPENGYRLAKRIGLAVYLIGRKNGVKNTQGKDEFFDIKASKEFKNFITP